MTTAPVETPTGIALDKDDTRESDRGVRWNAAVRVILQIMQYLTSIALARTLEPSVFGIMAMLQTFVSFATLFADLGFNAAIVQRKEVTQAWLSTAFWASMGIGLALTAVTAVSGWPLAIAYHEDVLVPATLLASLNFLIGAVAIVPRALLLRRLQIKRVALIDLAGAVVSMGLSVGLALIWRNVWPLLIGPLVSTIVGAVLFPVLAKWRPLLEFRLQAFKEMASSGLYLTGFGFLNYWSRNIDNIAIGVFMGAQSLAYYARAYNLMLLPINVLVGAIGNTFFVLMSRSQGDLEATRQTFLRGQRVISFFAFPAMLGLALLAREFTVAVYGAKWEGMIPVLRVLALGGLLQGLGSPLGWIYLSQGKNSKQFLWGVISSIVTVTGIGLGVLIGTPMGVALGYALSTSTLIYPGFRLAGKLIDLPVMDVVRAVGPALACSLLMAVAVEIFVYFAGPHLPALVTLIAGVALGAGVYGLAMAVWRPRALKDVLDMVGLTR